jgi:hypothetical protein
LHPQYIQHLDQIASTYAAQQCGCTPSQDQISDAQSALLLTAQRMQDSTFNAQEVAKGVPVDSAAQAFLANDTLPLRTGGNEVDLAHPDAEAIANQNQYGYEAYQALMSPNMGNIEGIMAATGNTLDQYAVWSRNDVNSGRVQYDATQDAIQAKFNSDSVAFLNLNGQIALMGASAGLMSGVPLLGAAYEGTKTGSVIQFVLASRVGAGVTSGVVNATSQLVQSSPDKPFNWINVGVATATGSLGVGGGFWWNTAVGTAAGGAQAQLNNWFAPNGENNNNVLGSALSSGITTGIGFGAGYGTTTWLGGGTSKSLMPYIYGNAVAPIVTETSQAVIDGMGKKVNQDHKND